MHDLYEGVVKQELKLFLSHSIEKNYFTIKELNQRICYYDFKDNRPSLIDYKPNDFKLRQSADQMINLFREFPMLIGDKIPIDERYYYSLLLLLQICSIVMCPSITLDTIPYLRVLIEEKVSLFKELYPTTNIIPKMHYMLHYPPQFYMFGPLINT